MYRRQIPTGQNLITKSYPLAEKLRKLAARPQRTDIVNPELCGMLD